jgi:ComF family protein
MCGYCRERYLAAPLARCLQCGLPGDLLRCQHCLQTEPAYDDTVVAVDYAAPFDHLVWALKFGHQLNHAALFAHMILDAVSLARHLPALPTCLLPVPLSRQRLQQRGFNQALEMARPLARGLGLPILSHALVRLRDTQAQSLLPIKARSHNVQGAFALADDAHDEIDGQHVALIDDVMTTGATLNELAHLLKRYGASRVTNLVFARTPPPAPSAPPVTPN